MNMARARFFHSSALRSIPAWGNRLARQFLGLAMFAGMLVVQDTLAAPPAANHPILGTWTFTIPDGHCSETYEFRVDGTLITSSGEARSERVYEITPSPNPKGFYRLVDKIIRENGKPDCFGEPTEPGVSAIIFIRFSPSGDRFVACEDESPGNCIGPLQRVRRNRA
jgi:hypothetical protein